MPVLPKNLKPEGWETFLPQGSDTCMDPIPKAHSNHVLTSSYCHLHPLPSFIVGRYFPHIWLPQLFIQTNLWYWELCNNKIYIENLLLDSYIPKNSEVLFFFFFPLSWFHIIQVYTGLKVMFGFSSGIVSKLCVWIYTKESVFRL